MQKQTTRSKFGAWVHEHREELAVIGFYATIFACIGGPIVYAIKKDNEIKEQHAERWKHGFVMHKLEECDGLLVAPALPPK